MHSENCRYFVHTAYLHSVRHSRVSMIPVSLRGVSTATGHQLPRIKSSSHVREEGHDCEHRGIGPPAPPPPAVTRDNQYPRRPRGGRGDPPPRHLQQCRGRRCYDLSSLIIVDREIITVLCMPSCLAMTRPHDWEVRGVT